jgi:hypothetical protein
VEVALPGSDAVFSENYFDLPAGRSIEITLPMPPHWSLDQVRRAFKFVQFLILTRTARPDSVQTLPSRSSYDAQIEKLIAQMTLEEKPLYAPAQVHGPACPSTGWRFRKSPSRTDRKAYAGGF